MTDEKKPTGLNIFAHLGGRLILDADPPGKPVDAAELTVLRGSWHLRKPRV